MSRFLGRLVKVCPPFTGTYDDVMRNYDSHVWRVVDMDERFSIRGIGNRVECEECKVLADTEYSKYPCGNAPEGVIYDEFLKSRGII